MSVGIGSRSSCRERRAVWRLKVCEADYFVSFLYDIVIVKTKLRFGHPA